MKDYKKVTDGVIVKGDKIWIFDKWRDATKADIGNEVKEYISVIRKVSNEECV